MDARPPAPAGETPEDARPTPVPLARLIADARRRWIAETVNGAWVLPVLVAGSCVALGFVPAGRWSQGQAASDVARAVLQTIAAASLTVLGVTLSLTLATLALTSQAYSPRALRRFVRDRLFQVVVGALIGTAGFALVSLRNTTGGGVPSISLTIAIVMAFASLGLLVALVDHLARQIRVEALIATVHAETVATIERTYPPESAPATAVEAAGDATPVWARRDGHVGDLDEVALARVALRTGGTVHVVATPGTWVLPGDVLAEIRGGRPPRSRELAGVRRAFTLTTNRRVVLDPDYGLRHLVDMSLRAESPTLNDPMTAREALLRGAEILTRIGGRPAGPLLVVHGGTVLVVRPRPDFARLVATLVDDARRSAAATGNAPILVALLEGLARVDGVLTDPARRRVVRMHARRLLRAAERSLPEEDDLDGVRAAAAALLGSAALTATPATADA